MKPLKKGATYDDLCDVPDHFVAEMFDGDLYASPRPACRTLAQRRVLGAKLLGPFDRRRAGRMAVLRRAGAALRQRRARAGPRRLAPRAHARSADDAYITLAPDWVCEVLSPSTETLDRGKKLRVYAREGVAHAWLVDPLRQTLEVLALESGRWSRLALHEGRANVRALPFDAIELELGALWI